MTSRELLYVKTIAEEKSITGAARRLYLAQPSLSQALQKLEEQVGTPLFKRTSGGLLLTYAGEKYYYMACQILKMYEDFEAEVSDINDLKTGRIQMGITNHLGMLLLPQTMKRFRKLCPSVEVAVAEDTTAVLEKRLLSGELDFLIMHAPAEAQEERIVYEILQRDPFVVVLSPDHPLAAKAVPREGALFPVLDIRLLEKEPMIRLNPEQRIRQVTDAVLRRAGLRGIRTAMTLRNHVTAQLLAGEGIGITMVPLQYSRLTIEQRRPPLLLSIEERYQAWWDLCIATIRDSFLSRADRLFLRCVREVAAEGAGAAGAALPAPRDESRC